MDTTEQRLAAIEAMLTKIIAIIEELQPLINQIKKHPKLAARKIGVDNKNDIPWKYYGPDDTPWKY